MDASHIDICHEAAGRCGMEARLRAAREECAGLVAAISHVLREIGRGGARAGLAGEAADVSVMIARLRLACAPAAGRVAGAGLRGLGGRIDSKAPSVRA